MPGYHVAGDLWEATVTVNAISGPSPRDLAVQCRRPDQAAYRVLWQVASPVNISGGATIPQGAQASGKIHLTSPAAPDHRHDEQRHGGFADLDPVIVGVSCAEVISRRHCWRGAHLDPSNRRTRGARHRIGQLWGSG